MLLLADDLYNNRFCGGLIDLVGNKKTAKLWSWETEMPVEHEAVPLFSVADKDIKAR